MFYKTTNILLNIKLSDKLLNATVKFKNQFYLIQLVPRIYFLLSQIYAKLSEFIQFFQRPNSQQFLQSYTQQKFICETVFAQCNQAIKAMHSSRIIFCLAAHIFKVCGKCPNFYPHLARICASLLHHLFPRQSRVG